MKDILGKEVAMTRIEADRCRQDGTPIVATIGGKIVEGRITGISFGLGGITTVTVQARFGSQVWYGVSIRQISLSGMGSKAV